MLSRFQAQILAVAGLFFCGHSVAIAAPDDGIIQQQLMSNEYYDFMAGQILINPGLPIKEVKTKTGQAVATTVGKDSAIAQYAKDGNIPGEVWRLTEVHLTKGRFSASATTFYSNGVRAKTYCESASSEAAQCVTATRKFCEEFNKKAKQLGVSSQDPERSAKFLQLGNQCADYAEFLNNTIDPNQIVNDHQRVQRDDDVLSRDLSAIRALKDNAPEVSLRNLKIKGLDSLWGREDAVGASSTGMKGRFDRLREVGRDFRALSRLATMCSDIQFGSENGIRENNSRSTSKKVSR